MDNGLIRRPSGAGVWVHCHGQPTLAASVPVDPEGGQVAAEGTAAHWLAEQILTGAHTGEELVDRQAPNGIFITGEMLDHVMIYVRWVQENIKNPVIELKTKSTIPGVEDGTPDAGGDYAHDDTHFVIADLKYGWRIVEPEKNFQLSCYAINIVRAINNTSGGLTHVVFAIIQPRASHPDGPVRMWTISVRALLEYTAPRIEEAAKGGDVKTGEWCRNCQAAMCCPALREAAHNATEYVHMPLVEEYTGEQLALELEMLNTATTALDARREAVNALAIARMKDKFGSVPGWDIDRAVGSEEWLPDYKPENLEALFGVALHKDKRLTPNQAREAGLPANVVDKFSRRKMGAPKIVKYNPNRIMKRMK